MGDRDRRTDPRAPATLRVEYKQLNAFFAEYTKNISKGGMFIRTETPFEVETEFTFLLSLPKVELPFLLKGVVQWVVHPGGAGPDGKPHEAGMGVRFVFASDDERLQLANLVEGLMKESLGEVISVRLLEHSSSRE